MKNLKSGNGVTVANQPKLVSEVISIINAEGKTRKEKLAAIENHKGSWRSNNWSGRPGQDEAAEIVKAYKDKFIEFESRKITGKFPRGDERINQTKYSINWTIRNWSDAFAKHLKEVAPECHASISDLGKEFMPDYNFYKNVLLDFRPFANQIRQKAIAISRKNEAEKRRREEFVKETGLPSHFFNHQASITSVQNNKATNAYRTETMYCTVKGWNITVRQSESEDWEYYSKAWHRAHGPKRTIDARWVQFNNGKETKKIEVSSFAGNYLYKAIVQFFNLPKATVAKTVKSKLGKDLKKVQLNPYFKVSYVQTKLGLTFYKRTFAGEFEDYCVIDQNGNTYHAATMMECVRGLKMKLDANFAFDMEEINYHTAKSLGYCESGIRQFCDDNDVDIEGTYTRKDLRNIVLNNKDLNCQKFQSELKQLGIILNCK